MNYLRRYTDLPALVHLLVEREITFLDPKRWDDRNDAFYMERYREAKDLKTLLAVCFTQAPETYHHWRVFCPGSSGVCLYFDHSRLVGLLRKRMAILARPCIYRTMSVASRKPPKANDLPFLKRAAFKDEREYRILYTDKYSTHSIMGMHISLNYLKKVVVNPWMPKPLYEATARVILGLARGHNIEVSQSTVIENTLWQSYAAGAA